MSSKYPIYFISQGRLLSASSLKNFRSFDRRLTYYQSVKRDQSLNVTIGDVSKVRKR